MSKSVQQGAACMHAKDVVIWLDEVVELDEVDEVCNR